MKDDQNIDGETRAFIESERAIDKDHNPQFNHDSWCKNTITLCSLDLDPGVIHWQGSPVAPFFMLHSLCDEPCFFHMPAFLFQPMFITMPCVHLHDGLVPSNTGSGAIPGKEAELKIFSNRTSCDPRSEPFGRTLGDHKESLEGTLSHLRK